MRKVVITMVALAIGCQVYAQKDPPSMKPIKAKMNSKFGLRYSPIYAANKMHTGVDFQAKHGTPVYATSDGVILKTKCNRGGYGNHIVIEHDEHYSTLYAHLSKFAIEEGQKIQKGQLIGYVGSSGMATGPHLHYEVIENGKKVDPQNFF
jgi:murein DD-endopeptidase MepM/ murein hydrolase activator NlpD